MCGIFGVIVKKESKYKSKFLKNVLLKLAILSEARGKDSSGICFRNDEKAQFNILKATGPISDLIKDEAFKKLINLNLESYNNRDASNFISFGHSRLVTNGSQLQENNNQPVIKDDIIAIHNGIITNVSELWEKYPELKRVYDIDTEILLSMVNYNLINGETIESAINIVLKELKGTVSTALFFNRRDQVLLSTNNGSLYYASNNKDFLIFASEGYILNKLILDLGVEFVTGKLIVEKLQSNSSLSIDINNFKLFCFKINEESHEKINEDKIKTIEYNVFSTSIKGNNNYKSIIIDEERFYFEIQNFKLRTLLQYNLDAINKLKRCTKCVLPETFPYIEFDGNGVCNYCNNYIKKNQPKPLSELFELVKPYRSKDGSPDVLIPFSGGRDSTYVLHYVKKELELNPIAYTYDWGMVTDLARRNIARVCGKLGVENIIVAADIRMKRRNIRLNIEAWLKKPKLGMIPLFMAGDKQFFKYANLIKKQTHIDLNIWGINFLENTDFKVGFCGVPPKWDKEMIYSMNAKSKAKLFGYVGKNIIQNPYYFNPSLIDTFDSFLSRYTNPRKDYYHFFDYFEWNENEIEKILLDEYNWETSKDLKSTWRIGDGTASFYNYIYYTVAGFSEFDTFRSNQIREGMISRKDALKLIEEENIPRYESLRWYIEIIGLDFDYVIKVINKIPKLYKI